MRNTGPLLTLLVAVVIYSPLSTAGDWYEYKSDNFTVYSDVPERRVNEMMRDLERFRRAALSFTGLEERPENRKLRVYHFDSAREFRKFADRDNIAGFYRETWGGPVIFSRQDAGGISDSGLMFHEYVHHLMRERSAITYPRWYSEGFAELLASAELRDDVVVIGGVPHWRLGAWAGAGSRPLGLRALLKPDLQRDGRRYWNNYYATAWLFTHYVQLGMHAGNPDYKTANSRYLNAVADGADPETVFEDFFGTPIDHMERELQDYMRDDIYGFRLDVPEYDYAIPRRALGHNEHLYLLAQQAQDQGNEPLALEYLQQSERYAPGWQENRAAIAVLGDHRQDFEPGDKLLEDVDGLGRLSHHTATKVSRLYLNRLQRRLAAGEWDEQAYRGAVEYAGLALEQDPRHLPAYRYLWTAHQHRGDKDAAVRTMMAAYQYEPDHLALNSAIGFYLAAIGKRALARGFLERVLAWSHSAEVRARAEAILQQGDSAGETADAG
ncbi:tetratricopeptide repeat protein [Microbulbifer litoralis]|uniref:tetratricopeptide repeat protein n=1 Tax=Microbulbifer litoralis TaxID=2933965 RepID=UPI0020297177|nr:hypothetical protein [Microbulbifer sp. GX H0434]